MRYPSNMSGLPLSRQTSGRFAENKSSNKRTRGDQKVLQFNMMYKWQRQNSYIIFQCNLPVYQYTTDICQKVLLFQSNRIPEAC